MSRYIRITLPLLFVFLIFSCVSKPDAVRDIPEYSEAQIEKINSLIEEEKYTRALQLCRTIDDSRMSGLEASAVDGIRRSLLSALDNDRFLEAVEYLKSMDAAGISYQEDINRIYLDEIIKEINDKAVTPALALFQRKFITIETGLILSEQEVEKLLDAGLENKNKVVIRYLLENYPEFALKKKDEIMSFSEYTPDKEELIGGTVTIWVDRGIRIERGIGYPDRVIGSGFYIDRRGYILTNYHVIASEVDTEYEGFSRLYIKYDKNEEKIPASVVGWDASLDIALLKVAFTPSYIYSFPEIREYRAGEEIFAIGSPGGLDKTITSGIISAVGDRRLLPLGDTIQVDVPINSGNSGGPVVDGQGNLVGVVFAGIEQFEGVNFIIPVRWILNSLSELYTDGLNRQSWLGFTVHESNDGLEIIYVMPGTSGFTSGIKQGDRIIKIDGQKILKITEAQEIVLDKRPGTLLDLTIERNGMEQSFLLVAEPRDDMPMERALELDSRKNLMAPFLGMAVKRGNDEILGQEYIIEKVYRGMAADETGLSVDDPFSIVNWVVDDENDILIAGIRIKKRKAGFLETVIQLGNYIDINNTI